MADMYVITLSVDDGGTAGTSDTVSGTAAWPLEQGAKLEAAYLSVETAITAHASNYTDFSLELGGTEVASEQTTVADTGNIAIATPIALALTGTGTGLEVAQGDKIAFKSTKAGTGVAHNKAVATLEFRLIR